MIAVICFVLGTMIGGMVAVFVMCFVQVKRLQKSDYDREDWEDAEVETL